MTSFLLAASALTLLVLAVLFFFLLRHRRVINDNRKSLNAAVYRDQLAELEAEHREGSLADADFAQARDEVQHRLLEEATVNPEVTDYTHGRIVAVVLLILIPLAAGGIYAWRGNPAVFNPQAQTPLQQVSEQQIKEMVAKLEAKLAKEPNDPEGWAMLARSYMNMDRPLDARKAFEHLKDQLHTNPQLMVDYAEALASDGQDQAALLRARDLVDEALKLEPGNPKGLFMAGGFAFAGRDFRKAATIWEKLMPLLEPGSQDANFVLENLNVARAKLKLPPLRPEQFQEPAGPVKSPPAGAGAQDNPGVAPNASSPAPSAAGNTGASAVSGRVTLDPALRAKVSSTDTVYLFARVPDGPRMPLAVLKTTAGQLPLDFELTDEMAMSRQFNLSSVRTVRVEARISKSGSATPTSGDLTGMSAVVKPGARGVRLVIDQVQP